METPLFLNLACMRRLLLALGAAALAACAPSQPNAQTNAQTSTPTSAKTAAPGAAAAATAAATAADLAASRARIDATLSLACRSHADCATLPIGARACGGPEGYLAYSVVHGNVALLKQHVAQFSQLRKQIVEASGELSTCQVPVDPGAQCTPAGQCQLMPARNSRGAAAAALR